MQGPREISESLAPKMVTLTVAQVGGRHRAGNTQAGLGGVEPSGEEAGGCLRPREQPAWKGHRLEYFLLQKVIKRTCYTSDSYRAPVRPGGTRIAL